MSARRTRRKAAPELTAEQRDLFEAIRVAARKAARRGCHAHVSLDHAGDFFASEFVPPPSKEWIRVLPDGTIEEGLTRRVIGTTAELGL